MPSGVRTRVLTTTEAAVLALLGLEGEQSGYDLLRNSQRSVAQVWAPARSQLYAVLPRLVEAGFASSRPAPSSGGPERTLYALTNEGRSVLRRWIEQDDAGEGEALLLRVFLGGFATDAALVAHLERFRASVAERLALYRELDAGNDRTGHNFYHGLVLELALAHAELRLEWASGAIAELKRRASAEVDNN